MGRVKQRLGGSIGQTAALSFYRACLLHTVLRLSRSPHWRTLIAVTPDGDLASSFWRGVAQRWGVGLMPQGRGDLGQRMQRIFDHAGPGSTIIVGSDIPALRGAHIAAAFRLLRSADAVLGPAGDGGYWLVGMRSLQRLTPFERVPWSTPQALADTIANLDARRVVFAPELADVDNIESFASERRSAERLIHQAAP